jgi:hypothetical protein
MILGAQVPNSREVSLGRGPFADTDAGGINAF